MNALDDPIIPIPLLGIAKKYAGIFKLHFTSIFEFSFDLSMQRLTINRLSSCLLTEVIWDFTKED